MHGSNTRAAAREGHTLQTRSAGTGCRCCCCCRDVVGATAAGFRDPARPPWEDRRQPLVPALAGSGSPDGQPADIPGAAAASCCGAAAASCCGMLLRTMDGMVFIPPDCGYCA